MKTPEILLDTEILEVSADGGEYSIGYTVTNPVKGAVVEAKCPDNWVVGFEYEETDRIICTVAANESSDNRETKVRIDYPGLRDVLEFTIFQAAPSVLVVAPSENIDVPAEGQVVSFTVGHNVGFDTDISCDWIVLNEDTRAYSEEKVSFVVAPNETGMSRSGKITFVSKDKTLSQTIDIKQEAKEQTVVLSRCPLALFDNANLDNYYIVLTDTETEIREDGCYPVGAGHTLYLDFYTENNSSKDDIRLKEGSYKLKNSSEAGFCNTDYTFLFKSVAADNMEQVKFIVGTVDVRQTGTDYEFDAVLYDHENNEYRFTYAGPVDFRFAGIEDDPVIDRDMNLDLTCAMGSHFKDPMSTSTEVVILKLADVVLDVEGKLTAPGTMLNLHLNTDLVPDPEFPILYPGTYTISDVCDINTMNRGVDNGYYIDGSFCAHADASGLVKYGLFTEGSLEVTEEGLGNYVLNLNLVTAEGHKITGVYRGGIEIARDPNGEIGTDDDISKLTGDYNVDLSKVTVAEAVYLGDYYFVGADVWRIAVADPNGDAMNFELFAPVGDGSVLPVGKYTPTNMYEALTFMPGTQGFEQETEGTWLLKCADGVKTGVAPAMNGWVEVGKDGTHYTISFEFSDGATTVHYFRGKWTGEMTIDNQGI